MHEPATDAGADGEHQQVVDVLAGAEGELAPGGGVGVVLDDDRELELPPRGRASAARRARRGWARRRTVGPRLVDEAGGGDADRLDGLAAGRACATSSADRAHDLRRVAWPATRCAHGARTCPARRRARRRSWCRRRRRRPCSSRFLVPVRRRRRRRGRSSRPGRTRSDRARVGREQPGRGVHQRAGRHRQVRRAPPGWSSRTDVDHLADRAVAAVRAAGGDVLVHVADGVARTRSRRPRPLPA